MTEALPVEAPHPDWPRARFNVSGLFRYEPLVIGYLRFLKAGFASPSPIDSIHGAPAIIWNGGRVSPTGYDFAAFQQALETFEAHKVGCFLTCTNHLLETADLADPAGNQFLDCLARRPDLHGVIVASDPLSAHIARRYPALRQVASIVKVAVEDGRGRPAYYRELGRRFWRYMVHPDDCHDLAVLDQLDREKAEVIVNEPCGRRCDQRPRHFDHVARLQKQHCQARPAGMQTSPIPDAMRNVAFPGCRGSFIDQVLSRQRNCNLTPRQLKSVYGMGFRHFKIQGRGDVLYSYLYDLVRYTLEPEFVAPLMMKAVCNAIKTT